MAGRAKKRILVVDDESDVVEIVRVVLNTRGYEVLPCYNGEDGLRLLVSERPDLVITDLKMPGMSGMEFIKRLRAMADVAHTPVLVISSLGSQVEKPDAFWSMGLGSDDFLAKPFDPLSLLGRVEYLLRKNDYVSEKPAGGGAAGPGAGAAGIGAGSAAAGRNRPGKEALSSDDPADVVRAFVDAWNHQDFETEANALSSEMLHGLSRADYISRRQQSFADDANATRHQAIDIQMISGNDLAATVACLRDDIIRGVSHRKDERYTLKKTPEGWKIVNVRSRVLAMA
jgi:CheY-like chemotaxis protein